MWILFKGRMRPLMEGTMASPQKVARRFTKTVVTFCNVGRLNVFFYFSIFIFQLLFSLVNVHVFSGLIISILDVYFFMLVQVCLEAILL